MSADDSPGRQWLAIGLDLTLVPTAQGGRQTPVLLTEPLRYRPNWGLHGMTGTGQTGAPLLCSSAGTLAPGDSARAVIIPLTDAHMTEWRLLGEGDTLRMFEARESVATPSSAGPRTPASHSRPSGGERQDGTWQAIGHAAGTPSRQAVMTHYLQRTKTRSTLRGS